MNKEACPEGRHIIRHSFTELSSSTFKSAWYRPEPSYCSDCGARVCKNNHTRLGCCAKTYGHSGNHGNYHWGNKEWENTDVPPNPDRPDLEEML